MTVEWGGHSTVIPFLRQTSKSSDTPSAADRCSCRTRALHLTFVAATRCHFPSFAPARRRRNFGEYGDLTVSIVRSRFLPQRRRTAHCRVSSCMRSSPMALNRVC
jgi:hypothetical protein